MSNDTLSKDRVKKKIEELSDREKKIIEEKIGIKGKPKSRKEVCEMFAISEDRLRLLEEKVKNLLSK